jgi:sterol desaturase/sphingolipid hydroxylase (fatty acid hydroxylase superfamily)
MTLEFETIRLIVLFVSFFGVALWESFRPGRANQDPTARRWASIFGLFLLNICVAWALTPARGESGAAAFWAGLLPQGWAGVAIAGILAFFLLDLLHYVYHRVLHAVPVLWRLHAVHHSDHDVDVATTYLHHPLENATLVLVMGIGVTAAGFPPAVLAVYSVVATLMAPFQHGNVVAPRALERWLSPVLVTGGLHRVHHSIDMREGNSNFGLVFSFWDRLFRTLVATPAARPEGLVFGVAEIDGPGRQSFPAVLASPFRMSAQPSANPR